MTSVRVGIVCMPPILNLYKFHVVSCDCRAYKQGRSQDYSNGVSIPNVRFACGEIFEATPTISETTPHNTSIAVKMRGNRSL